MDVQVNEVYSKKCRVCGDKALGFNFNGLSCESCKAFFRRNSQINSFKCLKEENCSITCSTRKSCKSCRLKKCFAIGMKKELVLFNRNERQRKNTFDNDEHSSDFSEMELHFENNLSIYSELDAFDLYDKAHLDEIEQAMTCFKDEKSIEYEGEIDDLAYGLNLCVHYIEVVIKFANSFRAFKSLQQKDQLVLLKSAIHNILTTRFVFMYDFDMDGFVFFQDKLCDRTLLARFSLITNIQLHDYFKNYTISFNKSMENDVNIRNLITAAVLFKSHESTSCPEVIRYQYFIYNRLLQCYLERKYKSLELATQKHILLTAQIEEMKTAFENEKKLYLELGSSRLAQVIVEIYNLL